MKYPSHIPAGGVSDTMLCTIDLLPTIARLARASLPPTPLDGKDVWDIIACKPGAKNPHSYYSFTTAGSFDGVVSGDGR